MSGTAPAEIPIANIVTVTLKDIASIESRMAQGRLSSIQGLPIGLSFRIARVLRSLAPEIEAYETQRIAWLDEYGKKVGQEYIFETPEKRAAFEGQLKELSATKIPLTLTPFKLSEFEGFSILPCDLMALEWLIVE